MANIVPQNSILGNMLPTNKMCPDRNHVLIGVQHLKSEQNIHQYLYAVKNSGFPATLGH